MISIHPELTLQLLRCPQICRGFEVGCISRVSSDCRRISMNAYFKSNNHSLTFSPISHAPSYTNASLMDFIFPRKYTVPIPVAISEVLFLHLHPLQNFSINTRNSFSTKIFEYSRDSKSRIRKLENRSSGTWKSSFLCLITVPFLHTEQVMDFARIIQYSRKTTNTNKQTSTNLLTVY